MKSLEIKDSLPIILSVGLVSLLSLLTKTPLNAPFYFVLFILLFVLIEINAPLIRPSLKSSALYHFCMLLFYVITINIFYLTFNTSFFVPDGLGEANFANLFNFTTPITVVIWLFVISLVVTFVNYFIKDSLMRTSFAILILTVGSFYFLLTLKAYPSVILFIPLFNISRLGRYNRVTNKKFRSKN